MKIPILLLASVSLLTMSELIFAQDVGRSKPLNNPMYSIHNYKHPNLAAAARRWETKGGVAVKKPSFDKAQLANYKNQMPIAQPVGGITAGHTPSGNLADRNYKIQRLSEPKSLGPPSEYYVKKQRKIDSDPIGE